MRSNCKKFCTACQCSNKPKPVPQCKLYASMLKRKFGFGPTAQFEMVKGAICNSVPKHEHMFDYAHFDQLNQIGKVYKTDEM